MTRETAIEEITDVMLEIGSVMRDLREFRQTSNKNGQYYSKNYSIEANELAGMDINFYNALIDVKNQHQLEVLNSEGLSKILSCCCDIAAKYGLKVKLDSDKTVEGDIIEEFIAKLTEASLHRLAENKAELAETGKRLLEETNEIDFTDKKTTNLEFCITKAKEYKIAEQALGYAQTELSNMASSAGSGASYDNKYQQEYNKAADKLSTIRKECPLAPFLNGNEDKKSVAKQINKAFNKISKSIDDIMKRIREGSYPIWHFDKLIDELLEPYTAEDKIFIKNELNRMRKKDELIDLILTIGPMILSVALLLIPGGASLILLGIRAGLQTANAVIGVASAVNDIEDAAIAKSEAYSSLKFSPELQQLMTEENCDINSADMQYVVALVSGLFVAFDVMDAADAFKLIKKCGQLEDVTRTALKQSTRCGEKVFQNCDVTALNKIGKELPQTYATEIFNMKNTTEVVNTLAKTNKPKVMKNLAALDDASQVPKALNFFPDNLNTNIIWLGMDKVDAKTVLKLENSEEVITHYNKICSNPKLSISFEDSANKIENKLNRLFRQTKSFDDNEKIVLLKETLPPDGKITQRNVYLRVQTNNGYTTFANKNKEFAWVTDPYLLAGKDMPEDFMYSVGFTQEYMKESGAEKVYLDLIIFKDSASSEKIVPNKITGWDRINKDFLNKVDGQLEWMKNSKNPITIDDYKDLKKNLGKLLGDDGKFNKSLYQSEYLEYFSNSHIPGTEYEKGIKTALGKLIEYCTGASNLYGGSGITISENGIENVERAFNNFENFQIKQMTHNEKNMKILRFEIVSDISVRPGNSVKLVNVKIGEK